MKTYKAHYTDANHDIHTHIQDTFSEDNILASLRIRLNGFWFCGMSFDDFELENPNEAEAAAKKFTLLQWGQAPNYTYALQRFTLAVQIPTMLIDAATNAEIEACISFAYTFSKDTQRTSHNTVRLDDTRVYPDIIKATSFSLTAGGQVFAADKPNLDFETSLMQICRKIKGSYLLKCCFGCAYSDYSPYGNGCFATMLCYVKDAQKYLQVDSKVALWEVYENGQQQQESFVCPHFAPRVGTTGGYRGQVY